MDNREIRASALRSAVLLLNDRQDVLSPDFASVLFSTAAAFENCIRHGFGEAQVDEKDEAIGIDGRDIDGNPEADENFRRRILNTSGRSTVHYQRILTDTGARLDEVASFYDLKRRGGVT